jgi:ribose/xylose/arabinose/galactoside ABC-type transport system permease subunit
MATLTEQPHSSPPARTKTDVFGFLARFAPLIFLIVLIAAFAIFEPRFLTPLNLFNILRQVSIYGLLAVGMTFVILTAGIDLSIGSLVAFAGLVAALQSVHGWGWAGGSQPGLVSCRSGRHRRWNRGGTTPGLCYHPA